MSQSDEEFHQTFIVLEHICDVNRITEVTLAFELLNTIDETNCACCNCSIED